MKSSTQSNQSNYILRRLTQKLSARKTVFKSSLYAGMTVSHFLDKLEQDEEDTLVIKVNKEKYDQMIHDYKIVKSYKIKQEMIRKEFKEKIILQLDNADDILRIAPETKEFKSTYGYVIRLIIHITTE
jgi:uncharacterized protein involved in tolerance to divalent cations